MSPKIYCRRDAYSLFLDIFIMKVVIAIVSGPLTPR